MEHEEIKFQSQVSCSTCLLLVLIKLVHYFKKKKEKRNVTKFKFQLFLISLKIVFIDVFNNYCENFEICSLGISV